METKTGRLFTNPVSRISRFCSLVWKEQGCAPGTVLFLDLGARSGSQLHDSSDTAEADMLLQTYNCLCPVKPVGMKFRQEFLQHQHCSPATFHKRTSCNRSKTYASSFTFSLVSSITHPFLKYKCRATYSNLLQHSSHKQIFLFKPLIQVYKIHLLSYTQIRNMVVLPWHWYLPPMYIKSKPL